MGWLEGLVTGYQGRSHEIEKRKMEEAVAANEREARVYQALLNSGDPKAAALAATGMLQSAQPRRKRGGLAGWMGEVESNPIYPKLLEYMTTPQITGYETLKHVTTPEQAGYLPTTPPGQVPAAQPDIQTTTPGAPPPAPVFPLPKPGELPGGSVSTHVEPELADIGASPQLPAGSISTHVEPELPPTFGATAVPPLPPSPDLSSLGRAMKPEALTTYDRRAIWGLPRVFPTVEDTEIAQARAKIEGEFQAARQMYVRLGSQNPDKDAADYVESVHQRTTGGYVKGGLVADPSSPTGYMRVWVNRADPTLSYRQPETPQTTLGKPNLTQMVAHSLYAQGGESPQETFDRVTRGPNGAQTMANILKRQQFHIAEAPMNEGARFNARAKLQDDWTAYAKPYQVMTQQIVRMRDGWARAVQDPKFIPAVSEELIVTFEKMLDPNSVVRESEARRPGAMQAWLQQIPAWIQQLKAGGANITLANLRPYIELAEGIVQANDTIMDAERARITATADQYGLGPLNLIGFQKAPPNPFGVPPPNPNAGGGGGGGGGGINLDTPIEVDPVTGKARIIGR
jgi:hypothetical protein